MSQKYNVHTQTIGTVTDSARLKINDSINLGKNALKKAYFNTLQDIMTEMELEDLVLGRHLQLYMNVLI